MSDIFIGARQLVECCQTLVLDPTSLLQQSLANTVPHIMMVHWYLLDSGREFQDLTKIWPNFLAPHHWCLTCSQWVCSLWRAVRPWSWAQQAYWNNHWWIQSLMPSGCMLVFTLVRARISGSDQNLWPNFLTTHHWCLACSQCVCSLWMVVRPWP